MGVIVRVIYCVRPGFWRVVVGPGLGMLDGGSHQMWLERNLPKDARFPNAEFRIRGFRDGVPQVIPKDADPNSDGTSEFG